MRIQRIHVDGFGHFVDRELGPLDAPLTVLHGPNEAGKSTMLAFMRMVLFGWPSQKRADHYPALSGGTHGGRLVLLDDRRVEWTVSRSESNKGAALEVTGPSGRVEQPEATLLALRGHATKPVFESVFAFSLNELQSANSLNEGDVSRQIYSAGMGAARLPNALKNIEAERKAIFKPGGSTQPVADTLRRISVIDSELRAAGHDAERYAHLTAEVTTLRDDIEHATCKLREIEASRRRMERIRDAWPDFLALTSAEDRLASLPEYPSFPEDAIARLERLDEALERARKESDRAAETHIRAAANARLPLPNERLLALGEQIERLREARGSFSQLVSQLPARIQQRDDASRELHESLRALGPDWDEGRLASFDASVQASALVDEWKLRLDEAERCAAEAEREGQALARSFADAEESGRNEREEFERMPKPALNSEAIEKQRVAVQGARTRLDVWLRARQRHADDRETATALAAETVPALAAKASPWTRFPVILMTLGIVVALVGFGAGGPAIVGGALAGVSLAGIGLWLRSRSSRGAVAITMRSPAAADAERRAERAGGAEAEARARLNEMLAQLDGPDATDEALDAIETQLRSAEVNWRSWEQARVAVEGHALEVVRLRGRHEKALAVRTNAEAVRDALRSDWQAWLAERHLQVGLLPATMDAVFARVETARAKSTAVGTAQHRVDTMTADIETYRQQVVAIAGPLEMPAPDGNNDLLAFADGLVRRHNEAQEEAGRLKLALDAEAEATRSLAEREADAIAAGERVIGLLRLGGTQDAEEFRRRARTCDERRAVIATQRTARERLQQCAGAAAAGGAGAVACGTAGQGRDVDSFVAVLAATDIEALEQQLAEATDEREALSERHSSLLIEQGRLENETRALASDDRASLLRAQRQELQEELREQAHEWAVATAALTVLREAQATFERERQPGVIKHAASFFACITDGRYREVQAPLGKQQVMVREPHGTWKSPEQLSRGTQEQLYLALRFGLIRQFNDQETTLPVVVDDILVNFDPGRAERTVRAFGELSQTNQVLVFTCHPHIRDLFARTVPGTQVVELGS